MTLPWEDDPEKLAEQCREEESARAFGVSVEALRKQRREYGHLLTGRYAGCSPEFARWMEQVQEISEMFTRIRASDPNTGVTEGET